MDKIFQRLFLGFFVYGLFYSSTIASFTEDRVTESVSLNRRAVVSQISYTIVDHVLPRTSTITNVAGRIGLSFLISEPIAQVSPHVHPFGRIHQRYEATWWEVTKGALWSTATVLGLPYLSETIGDFVSIDLSNSVFATLSCFESVTGYEMPAREAARWAYYYSPEVVQYGLLALTIGGSLLYEWRKAKTQRPWKRKKFF